MADDVLLRERVKVLARTLDAVARVIEGLDGDSASAQTMPASAGTLEATGHAEEQLTMLEEKADGATFSESDKRAKFMMALTGLREYLTEIRTGLQAPPPTMRVAIHISQAVSSLSDAVRDHSRNLADLRNEIEVPGGLPDGEAMTTAWKKCLDIEFQCGRLFADYLDLVRGIALRESGLDDGLCRIADALVSDFDPFGNTRWDSLTVPASRELRDDPIAGFVRIGFPEWSVWTLPLAMVDFASFLILEHRRTAGLRAEAAQKLGDLVRGGVTIPDEALASMVDRRGLPADPALRAELEDTALGRLASMLLLESLATAIMGPAYAWAALLMRVDPRSGQAHVERIRRDAVVGTLAKLEPKGAAASQLELLKVEWAGLLASAGFGPPNDVDRALAPLVELVAEGAVDRVANLLQEQDWVLIDALAEKLHQEFPAKETVRQISEDHYPPNLRHVLNAGWLARLTWPEADAYRGLGEQEADSSPLSRVVRDVCLQVIEGTGNVATPTVPAPGRNPSFVPGQV